MISVAVIITCFNHAQYTKRAIESLIETTKNDKEYEYQFALFDDCSTDGTSEVLKDVMGDQFIYWRSDANRGLTFLWNTAYQKFSNFEYIAIVNNDVIFTPFWCSRILDSMRSNGSLMGGPISNSPGHISQQDVRLFLSDYIPSDNWANLKDIPEKIKNIKPFKVNRINGFCMIFLTNFLQVAQMDRKGEPFDPRNINFGNEDEIQDRLTPQSLVVPSSFVFHYKRVTFQNRPRAFSQYRPG